MIALAAAAVLASGLVFGGIPPPNPGPPPAEAVDDTEVASVSVWRVQHEDAPDETGSYDWGSCVMKDGPLYRMWWTRPSPRSSQTLPYSTTDQDGREVRFPYPTRGDRIFYAESRDGYRWDLTGDGEAPPGMRFGPGSPKPLMVLTPAETEVQRRHVACPSVVRVRGVFYLYYEAPSDFQPRRAAGGEWEAGVEYHNQVFLATSRDGRTWRRWPNNEAPEPVIRAPASNLTPGRRKYGVGQPSVCYKNGRFILHVVDAVTGWPDAIVRYESTDPMFRNAVPTAVCLPPYSRAGERMPPGAVAKFAQVDICLLGDGYVLTRPIYDTDRVGLLRSASGVFWSDAESNDPKHTRTQVQLVDPRGAEFGARWNPRFLRGPYGQVVGDERHFALFYASGRAGGPGWPPHTWDICRSDIALKQALPTDGPPAHVSP